MSSKSGRRLFRTLRSRLTFWYAGLFTGLSSLAFLLIYLALNATLLRAVDEEIVTELTEWDKILRTGGTEALAVEFESEALGLGKDRVFCRLLAPDCTTLLASDLEAWPRLPPPPTISAGGAGGAYGRTAARNRFAPGAPTPGADRVRGG